MAAVRNKNIFYFVYGNFSNTAHLNTSKKKKSTDRWNGKQIDWCAKNKNKTKQKRVTLTQLMEISVIRLPFQNTKALIIATNVRSSA